MLLTAACSAKSDKAANADSASALKAETEMTQNNAVESALKAGDNSISAADSEKSSGDDAVAKGGKVTIPYDGRPVLLDFTASWCPPCQKMKPVIEELTDTYDDAMNFVIIDVDANEELAAQYGIRAVPTYIFLDRKGKPVKRVEGAVEQEVLENEICILTQ